MNALQSTLAKRFDRAAHTYDGAADVQKSSAELLARALVQRADRAPASILDLGSGTGYLVELLLQYFPDSQYTLNDISPKMLAVARNKLGQRANVAYQLGNFEQDAFKPHEWIVSNFSLQWAQNLNRTLRSLYGQADTLAFSCLLDGTFSEWETLLQSRGIPSTLLDYPTAEALVATLQSLPGALWVESKNFSITFPHARAFTSYLKSLGATLGARPLSQKHMRILFAHNEPVQMTYKVFFAILKRP